MKFGLQDSQTICQPSCQQPLTLVYVPSLATVYGDKTLTYFSLENAAGEDDDSEFFNPKQKVYAESVKDAVESVLVSNAIAKELVDCNIEIVEVSSPINVYFYKEPLCWD